jgi:hypothetical protein
MDSISYGLYNFAGRLRSADDQPRAAQHPSGLGEDPSRHEIEFTEDPSGHEMEVAEDQLEVSRSQQTRKSHYIAPLIPTNPESRPIIKPVGER